MGCDYMGFDLAPFNNWAEHGPIDRMLKFQPKQPVVLFWQLVYPNRRWEAQPH